MTLPSFLFGMLIASFLGVAFHFWRGGSLGHLVFYLVMGWVGFWLGQILASLLGLTFLSYGPLHLGMATLTCLVFLVIARWLSKPAK
jgi:uncharacterized membrane protein YeaQ/YmgE (transglycosylase-associated protein family)